MNKMKNLYTTIQKMLDDDYKPATIAFLLEIPVYSIYEMLDRDIPDADNATESDKQLLF